LTIRQSIDTTPTMWAIK